MRRLLACVLVLACARDAQQDARGGAIIDTIGGVVRVRNAAPPLWVARQIMQIGSTGGVGVPKPDEFGRITSVAADAAGNIYVADARSYEIRVFAPDGRFLRRFGRQGGGPGEFRSLNSITWVGDTLVAMDGGNARLDRFTPDGEPLQPWRWFPMTGGLRFYPTGAASFYTLAVRRPLTRTHRTFLRFDGDGAHDTLTVAVDPRGIESPPAVDCPTPDGSIHIFSIPFAPRALLTPAPGNLFARAWSAEYRIVFETAQGDTARVIESLEPPLPVSDAEWEEGTTEYRAFRAGNPLVRCEPGNPERPAVKPALRDIYFAHDGSMFVELYRAEGTAFDVFDAEGRVRGRAEIPLRSTTAAPFLRDARLYIVASDSLDVQRVIAYQLEPAR
jgi:hypothetical protein